MYFAPLAEEMRYWKEDPKGVESMCDAVMEFARKYAEKQAAEAAAAIRAAEEKARAAEEKAQAAKEEAQAADEKALKFQKEMQAKDVLIEQLLLALKKQNS